MFSSLIAMMLSFASVYGRNSMHDVTTGGMMIHGVKIYRATAWQRVADVAELAVLKNGRLLGCPLCEAENVITDCGLTRYDGARNMAGGRRYRNRGGAICSSQRMLKALQMREAEVASVAMGNAPRVMYTLLDNSSCRARP